MIEDFLELRNRIHRGEFRFNMGPDLWASQYLVGAKREADNVIRVVEDGLLSGYAVYSLLEEEGIRAHRILEMCANSQATLSKLIGQIVQRSMEEGVDFVFVRKNEEPLDKVFDENKFVSFVDCVIMSALLNPYRLLSNLSREKPDGKILKLTIKGFDPILISIGRGNMAVVGQTKPDLSIELEKRVFVELFFGKTSFLKEFVKRKIRVRSVLNVSTAAKFFELIKQEKSYIPLGDWT